MSGDTIYITRKVGADLWEHVRVVREVGQRRDGGVTFDVVERQTMQVVGRYRRAKPDERVDDQDEAPGELWIPTGPDEPQVRLVRL